MQVRTRPIFSVVTSPACSKTPTCFFMPVRVMWNFSARSTIEASAQRRERAPHNVVQASLARSNQLECGPEQRKLVLRLGDELPQRGNCVGAKSGGDLIGMIARERVEER